MPELWWQPCFFLDEKDLLNEIVLSNADNEQSLLQENSSVKLLSTAASRTASHGCSKASLMWIFMAWGFSFVVHFVPVNDKESFVF